MSLRTWPERAIEMTNQRPCQGAFWRRGSQRRSDVQVSKVPESTAELGELDEIGPSGALAKRRETKAQFNGQSDRREPDVIELHPECVLRYIPV